MPSLFSFLFRLIALAVGLVVAAGLAAVFLLVLAVWVLGAAVAVLTGRKVSPFVVRVNPGRGFDHVMRRARRPVPSRTPRADGAAPRVHTPLADVTDVEPK